MNDLKKKVDISVIIGFKDWGLERLEHSIRSIHGSLENFDHEVVIADYGSEDPISISEMAERSNAVHARISTDGEWSRSRALNAGVRASSGDIILATDADMLFTPMALARSVEKIQENPQQIVILQCRDLPVGYSHERVKESGFNWDLFEEISLIRPRWGMGGLVAVSRENWERLRGWDERMHTYGGEDIDFAKRAQKFGARIFWLDEPGVHMYHIWHPSSSLSAARSAEATAAIANNRAIHMSDPTFARNLVTAKYLPSKIIPVVTVFLTLDNTDQHGVDRTIASILLQTVSDIEVIVLGGGNGISIPDDGIVPEIKQADSFAEALQKARGTFLMSSSAGEIWKPNRVEQLLQVWKVNCGVVSDCSYEKLYDEKRNLLATRPIERSEVLPNSCLVMTRLVPINGTQDWSEAITGVFATGTQWIQLSEFGYVTEISLEFEEMVAQGRKSFLQSLETAATISGIQLPSSASNNKPLNHPSSDEFFDCFGQPPYQFHLSGECTDQRMQSLPFNAAKRISSWSVLTEQGREIKSISKFETSSLLGFAIANKLAKNADSDIFIAEEINTRSISDISSTLKIFSKDSEIVYGTRDGGLWLVAYAAQYETDTAQWGALKELFESSVGATTVLSRKLALNEDHYNLLAVRFTCEDMLNVSNTAAKIPQQYSKEIYEVQNTWKAMV